MDIPLDPKKLAIFLGLFSVVCYFITNIYLRIFAALWNFLFYYLFAEVPKRPRSMSVTSEIMAKGTFPASAAAPDPIIHGILYFKKLPTVEQVKELVVSELVKYDRFNSVPIHFSDCSVFKKVEVDVDSHIFQHTVQSEQEGLEKVESFFGHKFKEGAPWWQIHLVENKGEGFSLMCLRLHHTLGDGISFYTILSKLFTDVDGKPLPPLPVFARSAEQKKYFQFSLELLGKIITSLFQVLGLAVSKYDSNILFTNPDKEKGVTGGDRKIIIFPHQPLQRIKDIKEKAKCTVNDVMMSVTAGAIRRYCIDRKDPLFESGQNLQVRALLPVAFPRKAAANPFDGTSGDLRNLFTFVSTPLAINDTDPVQRLKATKVETGKLKASPLAMVALKVTTLLGPKLPIATSQQTTLDMFSRHSVVFSNVPGPTQEIRFGGEIVDHLQMVFPNVITQVGILSYNGRVTMNMVLDESHIKEPQKLAEFFTEEIDELEKKLGLPKLESYSANPQQK